MSTLVDWTEAVLVELGLTEDTVDGALVLDLARDVAHGVARPAAPLTTYLLGLSVGRVSGSAADREVAARAMAARVSALAAAWPAESAAS